MTPSPDSRYHMIVRRRMRLAVAAATPLLACYAAAALGHDASAGATTRRRRRLQSGLQQPDASVRGTVFRDFDQDGVRSPSEPPLAGASVSLFSCSDGSQRGYTRTDSDGEYVLTVDGADLPPPSQQSGRKRCYYVQFAVGTFVLPDAAFTTPKNGETGDLLLGSGDELVDVDAGVYSDTQSPTASWSTFPTSPSGASWDGSSTWPTFPTAGDVLGGLVESEPPAAAPQGVVPLTPAEFPTAEEEPAPVPATAPAPAPPPAPVLDPLLPVPTETAAPPTPTPPTPPSAAAEDEPMLLPLPDDAAVPPAPATIPSADALAPAPGPVFVSWEFPAEGGGGGESGGGVYTEIFVEKQELADSGGAAEDGTNESGDDARGEEPSTSPPPEKPPSDERPAEVAGATVAEGDSEPKEEEEESGTMSLKATVRVRLAGATSEMDDGARTLFEATCGDFLNEQLRLATPPIADIDCAVVGQNLVSGDRRLEEVGEGAAGASGGSDERSREGASDGADASSGAGAGSTEGDAEIVNGFEQPVPVDDSLKKEDRSSSGSSSALVVDVEVTGEAEKTPSVQEPSDVRFEELLVGTFNVQGYLFAKELKEAEASAASSSSYFQSIGEVRGIRTSQATAQDEEATDGSGQESTVFTKGIITAMVIGGVVVILLTVMIAMQVKKRRKRSTATAEVDARRDRRSKARGAESDGPGPSKAPRPLASPSSTYGTRSRSQSRSPAAEEYTPRPHNLAVAPSADSEDVEVGFAAAAPSSSAPRPGASSRKRVRRDLRAPAGKLGIMVANTASHGPAVHTVRPGSAMEGIIFENDIIVAVNGIDTREYTAEQITRVMKETASEERTITVLSRIV